MKRNYVNVWIIATIFLMLFAPLGSNPVVNINANAAPIQSISLDKSGLIAFDPLNNETKTEQQLKADNRYWRYGGSADEINAPRTYNKDTQGLHIGVKAPANGTYAGYYAVTPAHNAQLFHAVITTPVRTIPSNLFVNGIYVQTTQPYINYISCVSNTSTSGTVWTVGHTYSSPFTALVFDTLWIDTSPNQPLTRECTIITNGDNYLKVYLDGVMIYSSNTLVLVIPPPFEFFLEPQNSYAGEMLFGTYTDYYTTSVETIQITKNSANARTVKLVSPSNVVLAEAPVNSGTAIVDVGKYHFPLVANITVYDSSNTLIASTSSAVNIFGGDVYSVSSSNTATPPGPPTGLNAIAVSSSQINLSWTAPTDNGGSPITGYKIERSLDSGATWSTIVANTSSTTTAYSDTGLSPNTTYTYRVSAINSAGTSSPSNTAAATTGTSTTAPQPPTGLTATAVSSSQINLSWTAPVNDGGSPITGYMIERSVDNGATWSTIVANTASAATTYSDTGLAAATTYSYRVSAINSVGTSAPSNTATATTASPPTGIVLNGVQATSGTVLSPPFQIILANFNAGTESNRLLVVGVEANNNDVVSITFGGVQLTERVQSFFNNDAEFWYLTNPTGTANIVVTMGGPTSVVVGAYAFSGVDQGNPIPTTAIKHNTTPSSPTISLTTAYPNSWVIDSPSIWGGVTLGSPTCTPQWNVNIPDAITGASSSTIKTSLGSVICSWTASSGDLWDDVAIEVKASG